MAKRKKTRRKTTRRKQQPAPMPGWLWGAFGLVIGLSVAAAIYVKDREAPPIPVSRPAPAKPASPASSGNDNAVPEQSEPRFKFYDMLPNFEVVIPEEDTVVRPNSRPEPLETPGIYILQAGSFSSHADADRMKARLAMLGMPSRIQRVSVDDKDYHRVRIGPVDSLDRLNDMRAQLREAEVETIVIRIGE